MSNARGHTIIALDAPKNASHPGDVETQAEFLARLKAKGITQDAIADVLGIKQANVNTLFNPGKNGKLRRLQLDEAVKLARRFKLNEPSGRAAPGPPRLDPDTIAPLLGALLPVVEPDRLTDQVVRALSGAFAYGLELLGDQHASPANPDALAVAARAAVARFRELGSA